MSKNILLIGSSGGLGKHFATGFAGAGYNLALHYNVHKSELEQQVSELASHNIKVKTYQADITNESDVENMVNAANSDFGGIDILINNAGVSLNAMSWKMDIESWNKVISVNLTGPFLCIKHVLPGMRSKGWGRIVNISSVVSQIGVPGTVAYSVSKSGLEGLCKTISKETAKQNITINNISLGYFKAGLLYQIPEEMRSQIKESIPKKDFGEPNNITECMLYLISDNAGYITGQTININGGLH